MAMRTMMYAPTTGSGMASSTAVALGKNARAMKMSPMHIPTRRAAMPVMSTIETLFE